MSLIKKPYELSIQEKVKLLIYGQPGVGKTTLALSSPSPLLLDFDNGVHRVDYEHQTDTVQMTCWEDCINVLNENLNDYQSIVIDTGGKMLDYMSQYIIKNNPKKGRSSGELTIQGYGERKNIFRQFIKKVMQLNKHLIFVAHRDTQKEGDEYRHIPLFGGSSYGDLVIELDLVGYVEAVDRKWEITFDPTSKSEGKNTCKLPSTMKIPDLFNTNGHTLTNNFLQTHVINPYIQNQKNRIEEGKKYRAVLEEIENNIVLITDEVSANDFISRIDSFEHVGNSKAMAGQLMAKKARELGITYNKEKASYEKA